MFWIIIGLGVCLVAPFIVLHFEAANQMEQDIPYFFRVPNIVETNHTFNQGLSNHVMVSSAELRRLDTPVTL